MSVPVTPTSARRKPVSQGVGSEGNENSGTGSWLGAFGEMMGELLQSWGIFGALKRRGWGSAGARSTPNTPPTFSRSSSPTHEQIELSHLNIQNPCYLRIEGARPGRGHNFRATTLERPAWCDACAHLVFYHATTCANCSLTCHEQCQNVVSLDCKIASSDEESLLENDFTLEPPAEESGTFAAQQQQPPRDDFAQEKIEESVAKEENRETETEKMELEIEEKETESDEEEEGVAEKDETHEEDEEVIDEKDYSTLKKSEEASTLRRTVYRIQSQAVDSAKIEEWVRKCPLTNVGLQIAKELDGGYRGCLRIHLNLCRPINIVAGTRPPSIYDILQEDRTMEKTLTSFYMPRDAVKAIHITSKTTTREVIVALLRKFKVVDNPHKFALYERTYDAGQSMRAKLRRLSDSECPLVLAIAWNAQGITNKRLVLQENDTADIQWEAFSLPELANFLRILDREEGEYKNQIKDKYALLRQRIQSQLARIAPVNT